MNTNIDKVAAKFDTLAEISLIGNHHRRHSSAGLAVDPSSPRGALRSRESRIIDRVLPLYIVHSLV